VLVDLRDRLPEGRAGEGDRVTGVEDVEGGGGDDVLRGDGRANRLIGGPGSDRVEGRAGDDVLVGAFDDPEILTAAGPDADRLRGGAGDDRLGAGPQQRTDLACGAGRDLARLGRGGRHVVRRDCERVVRGAPRRRS
jgi:Ca2+-binding RTX toxin-like protein